MGSAGPSRGERRVKMNRMRIRIAERLKSAQNTCAMLTTFNEIDMSGIMNLRKTYKVNIKIVTNMMVARLLIFIIILNFGYRLFAKDNYLRMISKKLMILVSDS